MQNDTHADQVLESIQKKLFVIGAHLASDETVTMIKKQLPWGPADILLLEKEMDELFTVLPRLTNFVLPGGCQTSAFCHVARTVCRRAERRIVELSEKCEIDSNLIKYINRLSDYLFVLSRKVSMDQNAPEILWSPELSE
jgi:cob(I)alamin adenosyltransferase